MYQSIQALNKADLITSKFVDVVDWHGTTASKYRVTLKNNGKRFTIDYFMGMAHKEPPKVSDVLYSLTMDAYALEVSFSDWCAEYGYNEDSRKDLALYKKCVATSEKLYSLFSDEEIENFKQLLEEY